MQSRSELSYEYVVHLKKFHAAWKLLSADHAAFIASFLHTTFLRSNRRSISIADLIDELDQFLYIVRQKYPDEAPQRDARYYIESWSSPEVAWLSQRYTGRRDMPEVDLTPDTEKALRWLETLQPRTFVGTESRLLTIFQLLKELTQKIETDPEQILADLLQKKKEIEEQISALSQNPLAQRLGSTQIKERYYQLEDIANTLLGDFRQVEENFRRLDREVREKIALTSKTKGDVIEDIFGEQDAISDSDQGRSFRAFWEFLIHNERQTEFENMLDKILREPEILSLPDKGLLPFFRDYLVEAGNKVYVINNTLTNQLSKYLSDKGRAENKRIINLVAEIEKRAVQLRDHAFPKDFFVLDYLKPQISLPLNRPLFDPPLISPLAPPQGSAGSTPPAATDLEKLFDSYYVDEGELRDFIEQVLLDRSQVSLDDLLQLRPLSKGVAELIAYLKIAESRPASFVSGTSRFEIEINDGIGAFKKIHCPAVIFQRIL